MSETDRSSPETVDLPGAWRERDPGTRSESARTEYERTTADGTTFVVSVLRQPFDGEYVLRLSTVTDDGEGVRHDYPIAEYGSLNDARDAAETVVQRLQVRLTSGDVSPTDLDVADIRGVVHRNRRNRLYRLAQRLVDWAR